MLLLSAGMMMDRRVSVWEAGMPLPTIKGMKHLSYIQTEPQ